MQLSSSQLHTMTMLAGMGFGFAEVCELMELNYDEFIIAMRNMNGAVFMAFSKGRVQVFLYYVLSLNEGAE